MKTNGISLIKKFTEENSFIFTKEKILKIYQEIKGKVNQFIIALIVIIIYQNLVKNTHVMNRFSYNKI